MRVYVCSEYVCVCMCVVHMYVCVCMYVVHMYVCVYAIHMYVCVCVSVHVHTLTYSLTLAISGQIVRW